MTGKVLADGEGLESVGREVFVEAEFLLKQVVDDDAVSSQPGQLVDDHIGGDSEVPGHIADAAGSNEVGEQLSVWDWPFRVVVD